MHLPLLAMVLVGLVACGPDYSPNIYSSAAVQQANKVEQAVVVGVRQVAVSAQGTVGAVTGAAAGGIVGSQAPGSGFTTAIGALGGTVIGGIVGTTVEHTTGDTKAFEYIVRKPNGDLVSVTQKDTVPLALGQKVLVIAGNQARIVPDYTVTVEPTAPPAAKEAPPAKDTPGAAAIPVAAAPLVPGLGPPPPEQASRAPGSPPE